MYGPETKRETLDQGYPEEVADFEVDRELIEAQARELLHNREDVVYPEVRRRERVDNARTALMEALTASGHLSRVELHGESIDQIHEQVLSRLVRGYDESLPTHEKWRRFYEICEELAIHQTHQAIEAGWLAESTALGVVSDFADFEASERYGYRRDNRKGMVRSTHLDRHSDGTYTRVIEQVSRSNSGPNTTFELLEAFGQEIDPMQPSDIAALARPFTYDIHDIHDGVVDLQRTLDSLASLQAGFAIRYGEKVRSDQLDYHQLRAESQARESQVELFIDKLAAYEEKLDKLVVSGQITSEQREGHYKQEVLRILRAISTFDKAYAKDCFGETAAKYYEQAGYYELIGNMAQRDAYLVKAMHAEKPVVFCGVMIDREKATELGIANSDTGELISEGKEKWAYKAGFCRVSACSDKGKKTKVGPCNVCQKCEKLFDKGVLK